jgi:hypothetical protein
MLAASPSPVNSSGTRSAAIPYSFNVSAVAVPTTAIFGPASARQSIPRSKSRVKKKRMVLMLVNTSHW